MNIKIYSKLVSTKGKKGMLETNKPLQKVKDNNEKQFRQVPQKHLSLKN